MPKVFFATLYFMGSMYVLTIVVYALALFVRRSQRIDLTKIHKANPVE